MALKPIGIIPASAGSAFDHGAFDLKTRRVFVTHTGRSCAEVIDHDTGKHVATLPGFPEAAGLVAEDGQVLVTNRGSASLAWLDADSLKTRSVLATGMRPNRVAIDPRTGSNVQTATAEGAHTTALVAPDQLYVFSPAHGAALAFTDA